MSVRAARWPHVRKALLTGQVWTVLFELGRSKKMSKIRCQFDVAVRPVVLVAAA